jgi:hypothetical protein
MLHFVIMFLVLLVVFYIAEKILGRRILHAVCLMAFGWFVVTLFYDPNESAQTVPASTGPRAAAASADGSEAHDCYMAYLSGLATPAEASHNFDGVCQGHGGDTRYLMAMALDRLGRPLRDDVTAKTCIETLVYAAKVDADLNTDPKYKVSHGDRLSACPGVTQSALVVLDAEAAKIAFGKPAKPGIQLPSYGF